MPLAAHEFRDFRITTEQADRPVTLNVQEAFMMYIKVVAGQRVDLCEPVDLLSDVAIRGGRPVSARTPLRARLFADEPRPVSGGRALLFLFGTPAAARFFAELQPLAGRDRHNSSFRMGQFCYSSAR